MKCFELFPAFSSFVAAFLYIEEHLQDVVKSPFYIITSKKATES